MIVKPSGCDLLLRAFWLLVMPVALLGFGAWALHIWLAPPPPVVSGTGTITCGGLVVVDESGRQRIELTAADDLASITVRTPDGQGRVRITATRAGDVQILVAEGAEQVTIRPDEEQRRNISTGVRR